MQIFSQKYAIVALLEDLHEGYEYPSTKWPLHVTIADTFAIESSENELITSMQQLAATLAPFEVAALHEEFFGPEQTIQVAILKKSDELARLHHEVVKTLKQFGVAFNDPQYTEDGFRPHSTVQPHDRLEVGDAAKIDNLALVDMFPDSNPYQRKILKIFSF